MAEQPSDHIKDGFVKLESLGKAIVAARGDRFSANLLGVPTLGKDGGECVVRIGDCSCHIHMDWPSIHGFMVDQEDVGFGPEPVVRLVDDSHRAVIHFFYPKMSMEKVNKIMGVSE